MRVNNPRQLAASLYQHIYPRSNFQNMSTTGQREWIDGVSALVKAIRISDREMEAAMYRNE